MITCEFCGKQIQQRACAAKRAKHHFCSRICGNRFIGKEKSKSRRIKLKCEECGKEITKAKSQLKLGKHHFCGKKCTRIYYNKLRKGEKTGTWSKKRKKAFSKAMKRRPMSEKMQAHMDELHKQARIMPHNAIWRKMPENELRELFEDYKKSKMALQGWMHSKFGYYSYGIVNAWKRHFPDEYQKHVDIQRDNTISESYQKGRRFEYRVRDYLRERGYFVTRSPASKGPADLIAIKKGSDVLAIQCKISATGLTLKAKNALIELADKIDGTPLLVGRGRAQDKYPIIFKDCLDSMKKIVI